MHVLYPHCRYGRVNVIRVDLLIHAWDLRTWTYPLHVLVFFRIYVFNDLHDCVNMYILTAGMEVLTLPDYSLMSITVLQMSGTIMEILLFTGPACEYLMVL